MVRMNVSFAEPMVEELGRVVPRRKRSSFIVEAVREKLARLRQMEAVRKTAGSWRDEGRGDPTEEIRRLRAGWKRGSREKSARGRVNG